MRVQVLKNILKYCCLYASRDKITFTLKGEDTGFIYKIVIYQNRYTITVDEFVSDECGDIESYRFNDKSFRVKTMEKQSFKDNGTEYKYTRINPNHEVDIFKVLFKIIGDCVQFTVACGDKYLQCYHIVGKVLYTEETSTELRIHVTTLNYEFKKYKIVNVSPSPMNYNYAQFFRSREEIAHRLGKTPVKYTYGNRQVRR